MQSKGRYPVLGYPTVKEQKIIYEKKRKQKRLESNKTKYEAEMKRLKKLQEEFLDVLNNKK